MLFSLLIPSSCHCWGQFILSVFIISICQYLYQQIFVSIYNNRILEHLWRSDIKEHTFSKWKENIPK